MPVLSRSAGKALRVWGALVMCASLAFDYLHLVIRAEGKEQADHFCNSIGILQQYSTPSKFPGFDRNGSQTPQQQQQEDYAHLFATLIARCAKDIDVLIESLPSEDSSTDLQVASLRRLEQDNKEAGERLEEVVRRGEALLEQIQAALADIAQSQLDMQHLQAENTNKQTNANIST